MQLHQLKPKNKQKKKKRVGRGGKRGTYSGRGMKGQRSRAGRRMKPIIRELIKKYPKLRGYNFKRKIKNIVFVNLGDLNKKFEEKEIVSPKSLLGKKMIKRIKGKTPEVKILGKGKLAKKLVIENCWLSKSAEGAIEKIGGAIKNKKMKSGKNKKENKKEKELNKKRP